MERILTLDWDPLHFLNKIEMSITNSLRLWASSKKNKKLLGVGLGLYIYILTNKNRGNSPSNYKLEIKFTQIITGRD